MKSDDILDAIGNVDDACVKKAKEKKKSHKAIWITIGSLAACAVLRYLPFIFIAMHGAGAAMDGSPSNGEIAVAYKDVRLYYVDENEIKQTERYLPLSAEEIFAAWREKNDIGDEVAFFGTEIDSNGKTVEYESDGEAVVRHEIGDYFVYTLTISKRIEDYYDRVDPELLLESLKKTMTGYSAIQYDEYHLILE